MENNCTVEDEAGLQEWLAAGCPNDDEDEAQRIERRRKERRYVRRLLRRYPDGVPTDVIRAARALMEKENSPELGAERTGNCEC